MTIRRICGFETDATILQADGITFTGTPAVNAVTLHQTPGGFGGSKSMELGSSDTITFAAGGVADAEEVAFAVYTGGGCAVRFMSGGTVQCAVGISPVDYLVRIYKGAETGVALTTSGDALAANTWYWIKCVVTAKEAASSGQIRVDVNGVSFVDTGAGVDCRNTTSDHFDSVRIAQLTSGTIYVDDYHQGSTGSLGDVPLFILPILPTTDSSITSTSSGGGAGTYANVDEDPVSTADYNEWTAAGTDRYGASNLPASPGEVKCVRVLAHMTGEGTIIQARTVVHHSGSTGSGTYQGLSTGGTYAVIADIFETNPSTGIAWTGAEVDAMEIGAQVST
jgi:hypothetical protein